MNFRIFFPLSSNTFSFRCRSARAAIAGSASGDQALDGEQTELAGVSRSNKHARRASAQTTGTNLILLDEKKGRQAARELGLSVAGTLGVIDLAAKRGLVSLLDALKKLEQTTFRASPHLIRAIIESS